MKRILSVLLVMVIVVSTFVFTIPATTVSAAGDDYKSWSQSDGRWGSLSIGVKNGATHTMSKYGCFVVAVAKILVHSGQQPNDVAKFNPKICLQWLKSTNGIASTGSMQQGKFNTSGTGFLIKYGPELRYKSSSSHSAWSESTAVSKISSWINDGYYVIVKVNNSSTGNSHYMAVDRIENGHVYVMDNTGVINLYSTKKYSGGILDQILFKYSGSKSYPAIDSTNYLTMNYDANGGVLDSSTYTLDSSGKVYKGSNIITTKWANGAGGTNGLYNAATFGLYRDGYNFVGWSTSSTGDATVFDQDDTTVTSNDIYPNVTNESKSLTMYAIWEEIAEDEDTGKEDSSPSDTPASITNAADMIVAEALRYHGQSNPGDRKCASFLSFCARNVGISTSVIKDASTAGPYSSGFIDKSGNPLNGAKVFTWKDIKNGTYIPQKGDFIFYATTSSANDTDLSKMYGYTHTHVGLVREDCTTSPKSGSNYTIYTIEGNTSNSETSTGTSTGVVYKKSRTITGANISTGYIYTDSSSRKIYVNCIARPNYDAAFTLKINYNANGGTLDSSTYSLDSSGKVYEGTSLVSQSWASNGGGVNGLCNASTFGLYRDGYEFLGWSTSANGGAVFDQNDTSLTANIVYPDIANGNKTVVMYAVWQSVAPETADIYYEYNTDIMEAYVISGTGKNIVIPPTVTKDGEEYTVTEIRTQAFYNNTSIESIEIPETVYYIGTDAFYGCKNLSVIEIPETVYYIGSEAFKGTAWLEDKISREKLVIVNGYLIDGTAVSGKLEIPYGVTEISYGAFEANDNITGVIIPGSVGHIGFSAFYGCSNLSEVTIYNPYIYVEFNAFNETLWWKKNPYLIVDDTLILSNENLSGQVVIPEGVRIISSHAFYLNYNITSVVLPDGLETINYGAFELCSDLKEITIPDSVENIYWGAFYGCDKLETVYYNGSHAKWNEIVIEDDNGSLVSAEIVFGIEFCACYDGNYDGICDNCRSIVAVDEIRIINGNSDKYTYDMISTFGDTTSDFSVISSLLLSGGDTGVAGTKTYLYDTVSGTERKSGFAIQNTVKGDFAGNESEWSVDAWVYISDITSYEIVVQLIPHECLVYYSLYNGASFGNLVENWAYRYILSSTGGNYRSQLKQGWNHIRIPLSEFKPGTDENDHTTTAYDMLATSKTLSAITFHENISTNYGTYAFGVASAKLVKRTVENYQSTREEIENNFDNIIISNAWVKRFHKDLSGRYAYHTTTGGKMQFSFTGTQFGIVSYLSPSQGKIYVSIDDGEEFLAADLYNEKADTYFKETVFTSDELTAGTHTVTIRVEGKAYLDALNITGEIVKCETPIKDNVTIEVEDILDAEYTGTWTKKYAWKHSGHNAMYSTNGGTVTFDFEGDYFEILSYKAKTQGKLYISVDGAEEIEVDLYDESSDKLFATSVFSTKFDTYGIHTVTIRTEGKAYVDGIVIRRNSAETVTYEGEDGQITLGGTWSKKYSWSHSNHNAMYTSTGGTATFTYTGYDFKILSYKAKSQGKMYVSVDGSTPYEVDLYDASSDTLFKNVVFGGAGLDYGTHTVTITTSGKVYLDAVKIDGVLN